MTSIDSDLLQRSWRGVPIEVRRAERREQLIDAAYDLVGTEGWHGTTVRGVCQEAHLNARYFYESFDGIESLFIAVFDRLILEITYGAINAIANAGEDPEARIKAVLEATVRYVTADPKRARILFVEAVGNERVGQRRLDTMHATAEIMERFAWRETGVANDRIGLIASHLLVGGLTQLVVTWLDGRLKVSLDDLIEDAASLLMAVGFTTVNVARSRQPADVTQSSSLA
ncbi:MAG TPA: helix-turn-helix domain-containing protein [Acidimicrobiales bacterium]|jgi:AcrR family transcriptional regulator|nr:helix-turn-helix domain-containing protein [Acidimicrobiales bacterium]